MLKVWTCRNFKGFWPVGTAAVIVAENETQAKMMLLGKLRAIGLGKDEDFTLQELDVSLPTVSILRDGDY